MKKSEMEFAIAMMLKDVNIYSRYAEKAKAKNLPMIEQDYISRILGIRRAMLHLGYTLENDGIRTDCKDVEAIEYMHFKAIER